MFQQLVGKRVQGSQAMAGPYVGAVWFAVVLRFCNTHRIYGPRGQDSESLVRSASSLLHPRLVVYGLDACDTDARARSIRCPAQGMLHCRAAAAAPNPASQCGVLQQIPGSHCNVSLCCKFTAVTLMLPQLPT